MKKNKRIWAIIMAVALIAAIAVPVALAADEANGVVCTSSFTGGKYNQSFPRNSYHNTQGYSETLMAGLVAVPKDDDGHGHTWTIVADENVAPGTIVTIAVQTKGNNYVAYVLRIDGPGEFQFPHDVSLGRGYAFLAEVPQEPPEPEVGSLVITKVFDGINEEDIPADWTATIQVTDGANYNESQEISKEVRTVTFEDILPGTYTVAEVNRDDGSIQDYSFVEVTGEGRYVVAVGDPTDVTITNSYEEVTNPPPEEPDPDPDPVYFNLIVEKRYSGHELPEGFYILLEGPEGFEARQLDFSNEPMNEDGVITWYVYELTIEGTYTATEYEYGVAGYTRTGNTTDEAVLTRETKVQGADFDATLTLVNDYRIITENPPPVVYIPRNDPDPVVTRDPVVEEVASIEDTTPPLAFEPEPEVDAAEDIIIEEVVPLSDMPQTGVNDSFAVWACAFAICATLLAAGTLSMIVIKKNKKNGNG